MTSILIGRTTVITHLPCHSFSATSIEIDTNSEFSLCWMKTLLVKHWSWWSSLLQTKSIPTFSSLRLNDCTLSMKEGRVKDFQVFPKKILAQKILELRWFSWPRNFLYNAPWHFSSILVSYLRFECMQTKKCSKYYSGNH